MGEGLLGPLVLFAAAMCLTPGPNVVMVTATAANFGFRRSLPQMLGITLGFGTLIATAGLGLAGLLAAEPRLHAGLKYAGASYLLYLAWRIARAESAGSGAARSRPIGFAAALLLQWVNPKGWVTAIGAITAFSSAQGDPLLRTAIIAAVLGTACLLSCLVWGSFGVAIGRLLATPRARRVFNVTMALLLVASLVPVFW